MTHMRTIESAYVKYNQGHDTLHIYFPPVESSYDDEIVNGIIIRRSIVDERIIGVTILDLNKYNLKVLSSLLPFVDVEIFKKYLYG